MRNLKFRYLSLLLVLVLICMNLTACGKSSNTTSQESGETVLSYDEESSDDVSSKVESESDTTIDTDSETTQTVINGEVVTTTTTSDGSTVISDDSGTSLVISNSSNTSTSSSSTGTVKSAVSDVSEESDNSEILSEVSTSTSLTLHTFSPITMAEYNVAQSIVNSIITSGMSEYTKVKTIHDYLVETITYPTTIDTSNKSLFTCTGALINKVCVCQGYADAFSLLCYIAGVQADIVSGPAYNGSSTEGHAWNQVRINGTWYNIDCTWDAPFYKNSSGSYVQIKVYKYFLISDSAISEDHTTNSSSTSGYLAAKHTCSSTYDETSNTKMTDDSLCSFFLSNYYSSYSVTTVSSEDSLKSTASSYKSSGTSTYVLLYKNSSLFTDSSLLASMAKTLGQDVFNAYSGSGSTVKVKYTYMDIPTQYIFIVVTVS